MTFNRKNKRRLLQIVIIALSVAVLAPQAGSLQESFESLGNLDGLWMAGAIAAVIASYWFASLVYLCLAPRRLPLRRTFVAQLATGFANRVVPAGVGALGLNTLYLSKQLRISKTVAGVYAGLNNGIGFLGFSLVTLAVVLSTSQPLERLNGSSIGLLGGLAVALGVAGLVVVAYSSSNPVRRLLLKLWKTVLITLEKTAHRPRSLAGALLMSLMMTACNLATLYACVEAAGQHLPLVQLVLVFGAGVFAIAVSPTPGGLGAAELTMTLALGWAGQEALTALTIVLAFRLVNYWLPILPGYIALRYMTNNKYL